MKKSVILFTVLMIVNVSFGQSKKQKLNLTNAVVVGQLDNPEDRYSLEINLAQVLSDNGVKAVPSLNVMKMGGDPQILASDSLMKIMSDKGIDTYLLASVRGYDKKFKKSEKNDDFTTALSVGSLFDLYRQDIVSISFEFKFYRNGECVFSDIVKCGNISDRTTVLKRFVKKVNKRIVKKWK